MASKVPEGGILLAQDWKLVPLDDGKWELCNRHVASARGGNAAGTEPKWFRCGRFYSHDTVEHAMLYVMDELWKASLGDEARGLAVALANYRALLAEVRDVAGLVAGAMEASGDATRGEGV